MPVIVRPLATAVLAVAALLACTEARSASPDGADVPVRRPERAERTGRLRSAALRESSGVAVSRTHRGLLWTHNDSGREALFVTDTLGTDQGRIAVAVDMRDWEDIALGPCGDATCLYLADIGDNYRERNDLALYRVPEPGRLPSGAMPASVTPERLGFRYPDDVRQDAEAVYVDERGDAYVVTKGRGAPVRLYRLPAEAWGTDSTVTAELLGTLPIDPGTALGRWVTGAALSPDGSTVAVRTYRDIFFFGRTPDGRLEPTPRLICDITGLEPQGEGIDWLDDRTLVLTSEAAFGSPGTVSVVRCPLR